jgi:Domain of unknown function (DUF4157)
MPTPDGLRARHSGSPDFPRDAPSSVHHVLGAPGHPLDAATRAFFEPRFGHDFANVRIHDDASAVRSTRDIGALAYTVGPHVVVDATRHRLAGVVGQGLLAHELVHVVQQRHTGPRVQRQTAQPAPTGLPDKVQAQTATRDEVILALTTFLTKVQTEAGTPSLHVSVPVQQALQTLAGNSSLARFEIDSFLSRKNLPTTPEAFAREAVNHLPLRIPLDVLSHLERIPAAAPKETRPATLGAALGSVLDLTPLLKSLHVSPAAQAKIAEAARSATAGTVASLVDAAMAGSQIDGKTQAAIHAAVQAWIDQQPAGRKAAQPTSPYVQPTPPSGVSAPALPGGGLQLSRPTNIPLQQSPQVSIPQGGSKPAAPAAPTPGSLEQVIQGLDKGALLPPEARGKPAAAKFPDAQLVAREIAAALETARTARRSRAEVTLNGVFRDVQDAPALFDEVARIVRLVADTQPRYGFQVEQMDVFIEDSHVHRVIPLRSTP